MSYEIELTNVAINDIAKHRQAGNKKILEKINVILNELRIHPTTGTGKPEKLKHYNIETWSRRITDKHRLIYQIKNEKITVIILAFWGHYYDK